MLIDFQAEAPPIVKSQYHIINPTTQKEIGLVEITQIQGTRAMSKLLEGTAHPGDRTDIAWVAEETAKNQQERIPAESKTAPAAPKKKKTSKKGKAKFGVGANIVYTSLFVKNDIGSGAINGISGGFRVAYDYPATSWLAITALAGLHPQNAKAALADVTLEKNVNFLALEGLGRFFINKSNKGFWIGGGLGYYLPLSYKGTTKPKSEMDLIGSMGFNIPFGPTYLSLKGDMIILENNSFQLVGGGVYYFWKSSPFFSFFLF